jgi:SGNH hydrolase-like domain, acetyltransferase AlgX
MPIRSWLGRAVALAIGCAGALGLLETGLRALRPSHSGLRALLYQATLPTAYGRITDLPGLLETTVVGYRPYTEYAGYVLNSRGLRTREYGALSAPGVLRVVALGDSFVYGGVAEADHWCGQLERGLAARDARVAEVLRMGVPGTGPPFYLRLWEVEASRLGAAVVVVGLFVGNDFFDEQGRPEGWRGRLDQAAAVSYSVRLARNLLRLEGPLLVRPAGASGERHVSGGFDVPGFVYDDTRPTFPPDAFAEVERDRMTLCLHSARGRFAARLDRVVRVLGELNVRVRRSGSRLVVMLIPDEYQVHADVATQAARAEGLALDAYDRERPQRELGRALHTEGIDALDLLPAFRERGSVERLYVPRDTHWNRSGHRLAAEQLVAHLERTRR